MVGLAMTLIGTAAEGAVGDPGLMTVKPGSWYLGGAVGRGGYRAGYQRTADTILSTGVTAATVTADAKSTVWKAYVGYQWLPQLSIEGGYWNFGHISYTANITAPGAANTANRNFSADGWGADVVYWLPFTNNIAAYGKVGSVLTDDRAGGFTPSNVPGSLPAQSARKLRPTFGLGAQYAINNNLAARFEYENVQKVGDDAKFGTANVEMWTIGLSYRY